MKNKKTIKSLHLNKKSISTLNEQSLYGGLVVVGNTGACSWPAASDCCTYVHFCTIDRHTDNCEKK